MSGFDIQLADGSVVRCVRKFQESESLYCLAENGKVYAPGADAYLNMVEVEGDLPEYVQAAKDAACDKAQAEADFAAEPEQPVSVSDGTAAKLGDEPAADEDSDPAPAEEAGDEDGDPEADEAEVSEEPEDGDPED